MIKENDLFTIERDMDRRARIVEKGTYKTLYHFEDADGIERALKFFKLLTRQFNEDAERILLEQE